MHALCKKCWKIQTRHGIQRWTLHWSESFSHTQAHPKQSAGISQLHWNLTSSMWNHKHRVTASLEGVRQYHTQTLHRGICATPFWSHRSFWNTTQKSHWLCDTECITKSTFSSASEEISIYFRKHPNVIKGAGWL